MPGGLYTPIDAYNDKMKMDSDLQSNQMQNLLRSVQAQSALRDMQEENALRQDFANSIKPDGSVDYQSISASLFKHGKPDAAINLQNALRKQQAFDTAIKAYRDSQNSSESQPQNGPTGAFDASQPQLGTDAQKLISAEKSGTISDEGKQVLGAMRNQFGGQQQAKQQSSGPYGVPLQSIMLMLSGDPGLEKAGTAIADAAKPQNEREGAGSWRYDANGNAHLIHFSPKLDPGITLNGDGSSSTVPNYVNSLQQILQAKANVENRNTVSDRGQSPNGAPVLRTRQQEIELANGGVPGPSVGEMLGQPPLVPRNPQVPAIPQPGGGFQNGPSVIDRTAMTERGGLIEKQAQSVSEQAAQASVMKSRLQDISGTLERLDTGPGTNWKMAAAKLVNSIPGVNIGRDKITSFDELEKAVIPIVAEQSKVVGTREAAQIVLMIKNALPNANMTKDTLGHIIGSMNAMSDYSIAKLKAQNDWRSTNNSVNGFEDSWNARVSPGVFVLKYLNDNERANLASALKKQGSWGDFVSDVQSAQKQGILR